MDHLFFFKQKTAYEVGGLLEFRRVLFRSDDAVREFGQLRVLVNSAGTTSFIPGPDLDQVTDEVWETTMAVNVRGLLHAVRASRGAIEAAGGGEIVQDRTSGA